MTNKKFLEDLNFDEYKNIYANYEIIEKFDRNLL